MASNSDYVRDDYERPLAGAVVELFTRNGLTLLDTTTTDVTGRFAFTRDDGLYTISVSYNGITNRSDFQIGIPPEIKGDTGPADNTFTTFAELLASDPARKSSRLVPEDGETEPAGNFNYIDGAWTRQAANGITVKLPDTGAVLQAADEALNAAIFVSKFGVKANGADTTAGLNKATLAIAKRGGGTLVFDAATQAYQVNGPVLLPSNVRIDLNGQTLNGKGAASYPDAMFVTATLENGALASNIGSAPETKLVQGAGVRNGKITNAGRAFYFRNFVHGCRVHEIVTRDCRQVCRLERSFDYVFDQIDARGSSDETIPTYHFFEQINAATVSRISATTNFGMHLEGGTNAFMLIAPVFEGGKIGLKITGDCLGFILTAPYFEAIQGRAIDLRTAGAVVWEVTGAYSSFVDIIVDDGGATGTATIDGNWSKSNGLFNIGGSIGGFTYRGLMQLDGPRNYCRYELRSTAQGGIGASPNWIMSPLTHLTYQDTFAGTSLTDIRARALYYAGIIPSLRTGDVGDPVIGTIPYTTSTFPIGSAVTITIDTDIVWRPITQHVEYRLRIQDDAGIYKVRGDVLQDDVVPATGSADGKTLAAISYAKGGKNYLRLTVGPFNNTSGNASRTGKVAIVA